MITRQMNIIDLFTNFLSILFMVQLDSIIGEFTFKIIRQDVFTTIAVFMTSRINDEDNELLIKEDNGDNEDSSKNESDMYVFDMNKSQKMFDELFVCYEGLVCNSWG